MLAVSHGRKCCRPQPIKLAVTDLSGLDEAEREVAVREAASAESREPFDLAPWTNAR